MQKHNELTAVHTSKTANIRTGISVVVHIAEMLMYTRPIAKILVLIFVVLDV